MLVLEWLTQSIREMQKHVADVSDFVLKKKDFDRISIENQPRRDQIDLYSQYMNVLHNFGFKIKKDDQNAISDAEKEQTRLAQHLAEVEQRMDSDMEKHKRDLDLKIPQLDTEVATLLEECLAP